MFGRAALPLTALGTILAGAAYLSALLPGDSPRWAAWALAAGIGLLLAGLLLVGARRHGRVSPAVAWVFLGASAWVSAGLMVLLALPGLDAPDAPLFLGLPRRAAFLLLGVGLAPGLVVPLVYGLVFDRHTLSEEDLEHLREVARRVQAGTSTPGGDE